MADALNAKKNVMCAVMLRDIRTRFFNHGLGFALVPLWPLGHMIILLMAYHLWGRAAPYGTSMNVFFATGLIPTLTFMYVSRYMSLSLMINRPLLAFPAVQILDIAGGRAALEAASACVMLISALLFLWAFGNNPVPNDPLQAMIAFITILIMAIGTGLIISVLVLINKIFVTAYFLCTIVFYLTSGTLFVASAMPHPIVDILSWDPIVQCVEWMRVSFISGYPDQILDRTYAVMFAGGTICAGLALERILRPRLLQK